MDQTLIRQTLIDRMRRHGESLEQAAEAIARGFNVSVSELSPAKESIRREGRRNMLLDSPPGVYNTALTDEARMSGWYTGPEDGDEFWPRLREKLESGSLRDVVDEIDTASTKVTAHLADPHIRSLKKRGLVVGYVQSGKTANYTAVMAKAADAGYQLFIVLSGLHNNLRRQTQVRLSKDLVDNDWASLTSDDADFGNVLHGALISPSIPTGRLPFKKMKSSPKIEKVVSQSTVKRSRQGHDYTRGALLSLGIRNAVCVRKPTAHKAYRSSNLRT